MSQGQVYRLAASTVAEPLINKWVAWAHTVAPIPSSLHLQHYQIKLLQSYLKDPQVHVQTCQNPKLRSGAFVDVPKERAGEVKELMETMLVEQSDNLKLATSLMEFQDYLVKEARGQSLDPYYEKVPAPLRGYVELVYDYYHRPIIRFFEGLLYESPYYKKSLQSLKIFQQTSDSSRAFIMSTPRLAERDQLDWKVPFDSPQVEEFFRLDSVPQPLGYIRELLGLTPEDDALLMPLLTEKPVAPYEKWDQEGVRLRYFGHACVLIEWNGNSVLTDPCIGIMPSEGGVERFTYADLPEKIDYVLITHNHHDHFCLETLLRLRHRIDCLVVPRSSGVFYGDLSLKLMAQKLGFRNVVELETMEAIALPGGEIVSVPFLGEHGDLPHSKTGYVVRAGGEQVLFGADSDCLDQRMYEHIRRVLGPIETVFLGMECVGAPLSWGCGSFFPVKPDPIHERTRRYKGCDSARGLKILETVGAKRVYNYAMGLEPWLEHLLGLAYTEDATQLKESGKFIAGARQEGLLEAELLSGRCEKFLETETQESSSTDLDEVPALQSVSEDHFSFN
jgi:L-ascorbate metabolism protein UlaG (beta-lactamase superfamily)